MPDAPTALLVPLDTIRLQETEQVFIGQPTGFVAGTNSYYIADERNGTVHRYSATGEHTGSIGRRGGGVSEFSAGPGRIDVDTAAGTLAANDGNFVKVFDLETSSQLWVRRVPGPWGLVRKYSGGHAFYNHVNVSRRSTVAKFSSAVDSARLGGPFPWPLGESQIIDENFSFPEVGVSESAERIAVAIQSSDYVFHGPFEGPFDSIYLPTLQRRGSQPELLKQVLRDPNNATELLYRQSVPTLLKWVSPDTVAVVHMDVDLIEGDRLTTRLFLSLLAIRTRRVCPDVEIEAPDDPPSLVAIKGDTVMVLVQELGTLKGADPSASASIRRYVMSPTKCQWR